MLNCYKPISAYMCLSRFGSDTYSLDFIKYIDWSQFDVDLSLPHLNDLDNNKKKDANKDTGTKYPHIYNEKRIMLLK